MCFVMSGLMTDLSATILQIIPALDAGGAERTTVEIARAIVEAGGRALVVSAGGRLEKEITAAGGEVLRAPVHSKNPVTIWRNAQRLADIVRREGVDLMHVRSRAPAWSALWAARRTDVKLAATYHGAYGARTNVKRFYNSGLMRADLVIANSAFTARSIIKTYGAPKGVFKTIARGADLSRFDPEMIEAAQVARLSQGWGLTPPQANDGVLRLLAPGRLTAWKGQQDLLAAIALFLSQSLSRNSSKADGLCGAQAGQPDARYDKCEIVFCGDAQGRDGYEQALKDQIQTVMAESEKMGLACAIKLVGHCDDMPAAYAWADLVVAPSRRPEAFGRVAVEAGAMGKPVIACNHGGAMETILDGETGRLTPPQDVESLKRAIFELASSSPGHLDKMGVDARKRVTENFSTKAMCNSTLAAYKEILGT